MRYDPLARTRADTERLVVAGDSAGGNLAAVVALLARESMRWFWDKYLASPAAGHMPHLEQLERVSSLIDAFLAE